MHRLAGLETEYGCLTDDPAGPSGIISRVRNWIFSGNRFGLLDQHQRDWDEPAGNGGFLFNGGRAYVDMGHLEVCTPECLTLLDLVAHDRANDRMLNAAVQSLGLGGRAGFVRNNVDHFTGATFGCHENFLVRRSAPLHEQNVMALLAFLTLRVLYTGSGKVGSLPGVELRGGGEPATHPSPFQVSQRADYIQNDLFEWVQFNRALINTRDEPLADARRFRRLHLLHGDTSVLPDTLALKIGTTALVLDLLEIDQLPRVALADPVATFRALSHQPEPPWIVPLLGGGVGEAVRLLDQFRVRAAEEFAGRDAETDAILATWKSVLEGLLEDPTSLVGRIDWITKRWLFGQFIEREGLDWGHPCLKSLDLEFHHLDPDRNLALALAPEDSVWNPSDSRIEASLQEPPPDTRARLRSVAMRGLMERRIPCFLDWEVIDAEGANPLNLPDPFCADESVVRGWLDHVSQRRSASDRTQETPLISRPPSD
jgi:proteasome accessory factor A